MTTKTVTVFCRYADATGDNNTTWIDAIEVESSDSLSDIAIEAVKQCAYAWDEDEDDSDIVCVGIAEGDVTIECWDDGGIQ